MVFEDLVKGAVRFENSELDDLVILRSDGMPTYNFGVVVDDVDMKITHVIRGDDHVNNTPRHINIFRALGAPLPHYAHVPMISGHDGERLSKRHGAVSVLQYRDDGYLPEALLNYLARLGWSHGDDEDVLRGRVRRMVRSGGGPSCASQVRCGEAAWINQQHLKRADDARLAQLDAAASRSRWLRVEGGPDLASAIALVKDRVSTIAEPPPR